MSWLLGGALLAGVVTVGLNLSDAADFVAARVDNVVYYGAHQDLAVSLAGGATLKVRAPGPRRITAGERVGIRLHPALDPHPLPDPA